MKSLWYIILGFFKMIAITVGFVFFAMLLCLFSLYELGSPRKEGGNP